MSHQNLVQLGTMSVKNRQTGLPSMQVIDASSSTVSPRELMFRRQTPGPEIDLVYNYIDTNLPTVPDGAWRSIFIEPRLESGFPDIVIVQWDIATTEQWKATRKDLRKLDIRILHYLYTQGSTDSDGLKQLFRLPIDESLARLHDANVISKVARTWRLKSIKKIFAVQKLIAIEAKITEWRRGLQQAIQNTWFASESYLLLPNLPRNTLLVANASTFGVGIITSKRSIDDSIVSAKRERIPVSYASWLFNEWAWRNSTN